MEEYAILIKEDIDKKELYLTFQKWLQSKLNLKRSGKGIYNGYGRYLSKMIDYLIENAHITEGGLRRVDQEYYSKIANLIETNQEIHNFDQKCGNRAPHAALNFYPDFIKQVYEYGYFNVQDALNNNYDIGHLEKEKVGRNDIQMVDKEIISKVKSYIVSKGFSYPEGMIENFYLSLKSKPFVILAGISGTGKTRLVKLFTEAIGAKDHCKLVPVRPDWSDSSDLFGHLDLSGNFVPGKIIDFIKEASLDSTMPYFLLLDEMNLARVEYYMSDFLSIIETRDFENGKITSDTLIEEDLLGTDPYVLKKYSDLKFPDNLYIIGTVNMDETTFPFSKKVLDRANTIEFSFVDLTPSFGSEEEVKTLPVSNDFLKSKYLFLTDCNGEQELVTKICSELQSINEILQKGNLHVGYRVRDEIVFYMLNNKNTDLLTYEQALDNEIMQKILPRIQGSSITIKKVLVNLFEYCVPEYTIKDNDYENVADEMLKAVDKATYKNSATKIAFMVRRFEEDGFTTYWL